MKISFIIPAYNEEKYIGKCLESIIKEVSNSAIDSEIIVVNNASTDCTKEVASSFANVKIIDEPQKGLTFARQAGFNASTGDYIAHIDADSTIPTGWLNKVTKKITKNKKAVAISGPVVYDDLTVSLNLIVRLWYYVAYLSYLINRFITRKGSLGQGSNIVITRQALQKIGGYNTSFAFYGEDTELARRLSKAGPVIFSFDIPMYTSGRRIKQEGLITMGWRYQMNYVWALAFKKPFDQDYTDVRPAEPKTNTAKTDIKRLNNFLLGAKACIALIVLAMLFHSPSNGVLVAKAQAIKMDTRMDHMFSYTKSTIKKIHFHRHPKPLTYG